MSESPNFDDLPEDKPAAPSPTPNSGISQNSQNSQNLPDFDSLPDDSETYGSPSEMAKTALEQGISGLTLGASKVLETHGIPGVMGPLTTPEAIAAREQANPITATLSNIGGTTALIAGTGGLGGAGVSANALGRIGVGALEAGGIGGISQATEDWSQNKALDAQKIAASAGLGALLGVAGSSLVEGLKYKLGTPLAKSADSAIDDILKAPEGIHPPVISQIDAAAYQNGDFPTVIQNSSAISKEDVPKVLEGLNEIKPDGAKVTEAAQIIGSPVLEGMVNKNKYIQMAEDSLLNGPPTYSGIKRQTLYQKVYDSVAKATDDVLGEGTTLTKAELGNQFKGSIIRQIQQEAQPINAIYNEIKKYHSIIPLTEDAAESLGNDLENMQEFKIAPSSPEGQITKRVLNELPNLKTVDDIKTYKSILNRSISPTAPAGEKRIVGIISDRLGSLENQSVLNFANGNNFPPEAKGAISQLVSQREAADVAYKPFRQNLNTLAEQLGKGRVYGAQDAIDFIQNRLTPEEVTQKLFSKKDSQFLKFFAKNYPNQMRTMQQYQKGILRDAASKSGALTPTNVFKEVNKFEPEIQQAIFSPVELQKLKAAETIQKSIPKSFNTSNTNNVAAFRSFMTSPTGALIGNARDLAIQQFIKSGGGIKNATTEALQNHVSQTSGRVDSKIRAIFSGLASQTRKIP